MTTAPQKKSQHGEPWRGTPGAGFGRVFIKKGSRTREKARFLRTFPVDPGGSPRGRMLARAVCHI